MKSAAQGFTLIELLVVLVIAAILMVVGVPSFKSFTAGQRVKTATGDFLIAATFARSEAIKRNTTVTLAATGGSWQGGWTITAVTDPIPSPPTTVTLKTQPAFAGVVMTPKDSSGNDVAIAPLIYVGSGRLDGAAPIVQIEGLDGDPRRCISFDLSGLPRTKVPKTQEELC